MSAKMKAPSRPLPLRHATGPLAGPLPIPNLTTEERLQRIEAMGQRISGCVQFMCKIGELSGTSSEAKEKAVTAFYERMVLLEGHLARIQEELQLG